MGTGEKQFLNNRTRLRNDSLWIPLDWGGLMTPLAAQQAAMDSLARPGIENFMVVSDANWDIKESQRDRTHELSLAEIADQRQIADDKASTGRAKLAIQRLVDEHTLAVRIYDAKARSLLMGVKEYAAQVELEQLDVEKSKAILAVAKEDLHQKQVNASIYHEYIQKAMVEADVAKSQVEAAKARIRATIADIEAGEADIRVITAQIEQYMAQAEKAGLQADVAMIFADILVKKLSVVKLGIGQAEIAAGFGYIQSKLDDTLALYDTQKLIEGIKIEAEAALKVEADLTLAAEKAEQNLRNLEADYAQQVLTYEIPMTAQNIAQERQAKMTVIAARTAVAAARSRIVAAREEASSQAAGLVASAQESVHGGRKITAISKTEATEIISG